MDLNSDQKLILKNYFNPFFEKSHENLTVDPRFYTQFESLESINKLPFLFEIDAFCCRLLIAKIKNEKICIYADFDTDAVTATGVMFHGLIDLGFSKDLLKFYTPDRFREGYGINAGAIVDLANNFDLIITVDCGISSEIEADLVLNLKGCDLIITDHHVKSGGRPNALCVCNPRLNKFYVNKDGILPDFNQLKTDLENLLPGKEKDKFQNWLETFEKIKNNKMILKEETGNSDIFLSESVTGVGVSWFCLVWLGYFLEVIFD